MAVSNSGIMSADVARQPPAVDLVDVRWMGSSVASSECGTLPPFVIVIGVLGRRDVSATQVPGADFDVRCQRSRRSVCHVGEPDRAAPPVAGARSCRWWATTRLWWVFAGVARHLEETGMSLTISLLGPLRVTDEDGRVAVVEGLKARCLLVILTLARGTVVPADRLIDELWDGCPPPHPEASFHAHVCRLRRALARSDGSSPIVTRKPGYELVLAEVEVDADRFERLADAARVALADGGPPPPGSTPNGFWRCGADRRSSSTGTVRSQFSRHCVWKTCAWPSSRTALTPRSMLGQHGSLVPEFDRLVAEHPFRERLHGQRMLALYRSGRQADALRAYRHAATLLRDALGVTPGPALRNLEAAILRQDPGLIGDQDGGDLVGAAQRAGASRGHALGSCRRRGDVSVRLQGRGPPL